MPASTRRPNRASTRSLWACVAAAFAAMITPAQALADYPAKPAISTRLDREVVHLHEPVMLRIVFSSPGDEIAGVAPGAPLRLVVTDEQGHGRVYHTACRSSLTKATDRGRNGGIDETGGPKGSGVIFASAADRGLQGRPEGS